MWNLELLQIQKYYEKQILLREGHQQDKRVKQEVRKVTMMAGLHIQE
jgi:hypothetical protein